MNLVFEHIDERGSWVDSLVFPLVFLWRHAIELQLKRIIVDGARLREVEPAERFHHKLSTLWTLAKAEIIALDDVEPEGAESVGKILTELDELDPYASGFRFYTDKDGAPSLRDPPERLDLANLQRVLTEVHSFLECGATEIEHRLDSIA